MSPTSATSRNRPRTPAGGRVVERRPLPTSARRRSGGPPGERGEPRATPAHPARWALLPLRAFLGLTYCFAGLQKLANPGFLNASNPGSIQSQLAGAARLSPIRGLVAPLVHVAVPLGVLIAVAELAVGLGTVLGLWTRLAAAGGAAIALSLFLTVSFHARPYYTGSDIVFLFAWTPLLLAGPDELLSVDALARRRGDADPDVAPGLSRRPDTDLIDRRTITRKGIWTALAAAVGLMSGAVAAGVGRAMASGGPGTAGGNAGGSLTTPTSVPAGPASPTTSTTAPAASGSRPPGTAIGPARDVPVSSVRSFQDPASGDPTLILQPSAGRFLAFDAVCPHAGCIVQYDGSLRAFVCPCHGSEFNAETGAVESGPAPSGLGRLTVREGSDGLLYVD